VPGRALSPSCLSEPIACRYCLRYSHSSSRKLPEQILRGDGDTNIQFSGMVQPRSFRAAQPTEKLRKKLSKTLRSAARNGSRRPRN
jgi:hypothetical protein